MEPPPTLFFRKQPLKWSQTFKYSSEFPDQRTTTFSRSRVVGYIDLSQNKSSPIYEVERGDHCLYRNPGEPKKRFLDIESCLERFFIYNTGNPDDPKFCKTCSGRNFIDQHTCPFCRETCANFIFPYAVLHLPQSFRRSVRYVPFPDELKEELMMKTCHPARKNLFQSIMPIGEWEDLV
jgi:hypothetical protein